MIISEVLTDKVQLEPCSDDLPDNGFLHWETDTDTSSLPPGLEYNAHNNFCHIYFDEDSSMTPIFDLATAGLQISDRLAGKPPNKSTGFSCKTIMKCFFVCGIPLASLWSPRKSSVHSWAQNFVNTSVNKFHSANKKFDNTLNSLHPMVKYRILYLWTDA